MCTTSFDQQLADLQLLFGLPGAPDQAQDGMAEAQVSFELVRSGIHIPVPAAFSVRFYCTVNAAASGGGCAQWRR